MKLDSLSTPLVHSPINAGIRISVSTRAIYELIAKGQLRSFKSGKRRLIPESELQQYVQRKLAQSKAGDA